MVSRLLSPSSDSAFKNPRLAHRISTLNVDDKDAYMTVEFGSYSLWGENEKPEVTKFEYQMLYNHLSDVGVFEELTETQEIGFLKTGAMFVAVKTDRKKYYIEDVLYQSRSRQKPHQVVLKSREIVGWQKYTQMTTLTKYKLDRIIYELGENTSLHLTEMTNLKTKKVAYYVQMITLLDRKVNLGLIENLSAKVELDLHATVFAYDINDYLATVKIFNSLGSVGGDKTFDTSIVEQARHLTPEDLVKGGIVGGVGAPYAVTYMVEGSRRFLIIHNQAIWLVDPVHNWIKRITGRLPLQVENLFDRMDGLIIDGVLVDQKQLKPDGNGGTQNAYRANEILYVYDLLDAKKSKFLQRPFMATFSTNQKPIPQRYDTDLLNKLNMLFEALFRPKALRYKFKITTLDHIMLAKKRNRDIGGRSLDSFCLAIYEMLQKQKNKVMDIKGLLFRPTTKTYGTVVGVPGRDRVLTKTAEVCKWEFAGKTRLRLRLRITEAEEADEALAYTYYGLVANQTPMDPLSADQEVSFEGTEEYPFYSDTMVDYDNLLLGNSEVEDLDGKVIEFYWDEAILVPNKVLTGGSPDSMFTLKSAWRYVQDPITAKTLMGDNNMFFTYQQRSLRTKLLKQASKPTFNPHLLDFNVLTSSIKSWAKYYGNVIGLVPNPGKGILETIVKEVLTVYGYKPLVLAKLDVEKIAKARNDHQRVILVLTDAANTSFLTGVINAYLDDKVDVIVSFYETEQWWTTQRRYKGATETVSKTLIPGGKFVYLVFNSENMEKQYNTKLSNLKIEGEKFYTEKKTKVEFNLDVFPEAATWYGSWRKGRVKAVSVPKINLDRLVIDLEKSEFRQTEDRRSDSENIFHPKSNLLASLFNYGVFQKLTTAARTIITKPSRNIKKAYVFLLMKGDNYLPGILAVAQSLKLVGSTIDRVCMITKPDEKLGTVSKATRAKIKRSGLFTKIVDIDYFNAASIALSEHGKQLYGDWMSQSYTKWQCLNFTEYDKLIFLDADLIVLENIDHLFDVQAPAGTFSFVRKKEFPSGNIVADINKGFPREHNAEIPSKLVMEKLILPSTFMASLAIIEPSKEKYKEYTELLKEIIAEPNKVVTRGKRYDEGNGVLVEEDITLLDIAGTDERSLVYLYSRTGKDRNWRNVHPRYNLAVGKANWIIKPGTYDPETEKGRYYTPSVIHYIQESKPWKIDRMQNKQDFITIKFWYYVFITILEEGKIKLTDFKTKTETFISQERYKTILGLLKLTPSKRKNYFRYAYNPKIHSRTDPWAANPDFDPFGLKFKREKPKREPEWTFDPATVFILTNKNYARFYEQSAPGEGYDEIIPHERKKEFTELRKIPNWRYKLWAVTARGGFPEAGEDKWILTLTKNATLVSERNPETERFRIPVDFWALMNNRHRLIKRAPKPRPAPKKTPVTKTTNSGGEIPTIYEALGTKPIKRTPVKRTPRKITRKTYRKVPSP